jgi:hypothetical protein
VATAAGSGGLCPSHRSCCGPRFNRIHGEPIPLPRLRAAVLQARDDFRAARYHRLPTTLTKLIAAAQITNDAASNGDHAEVSTVLADVWILAADFAVKVK